MTKWSEIAKEPIPEGYAPVYVTDGVNVSFVKRASQPFTEAERFIVAEPEAELLKFPPLVDRPTHWAMSVPGLPKVEAKELPAESAGGPPSPAGLHPEPIAKK